MSSGEDVLVRNGQASEARTLWHELIPYASDLGLLAEEIDPATGAFLGNLPQGPSHLSLLNAAALLDEQRGDDGLEQAE
jgi:GH15 family glucan-1,4-alpha-glucosidase